MLPPPEPADALEPETKIVFLVKPANLFGGSSIDDLEGEHSIIGTVDRTIPLGGTYSLEKHLLPGISRPARRAMGDSGMEGLLRSAEKILGKSVGTEVLKIEGPAMIITTVAVF